MTPTTRTVSTSPRKPKPRRPTKWSEVGKYTRANVLDIIMEQHHEALLDVSHSSDMPYATELRRGLRLAAKELRAAAKTSKKR